MGGVRGDRGRALTPQSPSPSRERGVGNAYRDRRSGVAGQTAPSHVADLVLAVPVPTAGGHRPDTSVGAVGVDGQHQPLGQHLDGQRATAGDSTNLT